MTNVFEGTADARQSGDVNIMTINDPLSAIGIAAFSLACYQDGEPFKAGLCAGIAAMGFLTWLMRYLAQHS